MTREEFSDLALSYLKEITAFARRLTGNNSDADDSVQATFERAFGSWRKLREPAACRPWLFRIARNLFVDSKRAAAVRSQLSLAVGGEVSAPAFIVPAETVERLTACELEAALDRLPREQREALLLCDLWGFQYAEIADGELAPRERSGVDAHLASCASCQEQVTSARSLKHAIARLASSEEPPGAVRARVEALRFGRAGFSFARKPVWIAGVVLLLAAILAAVAVRNAQSPGARLARELVSDHLEVAPAEVVSNDPQRFIRFFEGRVPFTPIAPQLPDARLTGGQLCELEGRRAQLLFYTCGRQTLSVFVLDRDPGDGRCRQSRGHHVCNRRLGSLTLLAVGEISGQTLEQLLREATL